MSLNIAVSSDAVRSPLSRSAIAEVARRSLRAERVHHALLSITVVNGPTIARLNKSYLGHAGRTDVISFGFDRATAADPVVGDVYICADVARRSARARGVGVREEIARLVIHGVLHVLGYDHPTGDGRERSAMWKRQERLVDVVHGVIRR